MKNNAPFFWAVAGDGAGGTLGFGVFFTLEEAQAWFAALDAGGSGSVAPTVFWFLLNKYVVGLLLNESSFVHGTNFLTDWTNSGFATQNKSVADNFNTDNAPGGTWQSDPSDKKWQENITQAKQELAVTGKTKVGTLTLTVIQVLGFAIVALSRLNNNLLANAALPQLQFIFTQLVAKKITDAEALTRYEKIVATYPKLFFS